MDALQCVEEKEEEEEEEEEEGGGEATSLLPAHKPRWTAAVAAVLWDFGDEIDKDGERET